MMNKVYNTITEQIKVHKTYGKIGITPPESCYFTISEVCLNTIIIQSHTMQQKFVVFVKITTPFRVFVPWLVHDDL